MSTSQMKIRIEIVIATILIVCGMLSAWNYYQGKSQMFPLQDFVFEVPEEVYTGKQLKAVSTFHKERDDCVNPSIKRFVANQDVGEVAEIYLEVPRGVVQYPKAKDNRTQKFTSLLVMPEQFPPGEAVIIYDFCYTCNGAKTCRSFTSNPTIVKRSPESP